MERLIRPGIRSIYRFQRLKFLDFATSAPYMKSAFVIHAQTRGMIYVSLRVLKKGSGKVIRRILEHLGLWLSNARPAPRAHSPPVQPAPFEDFFSQLPALEEEDFSQVPPPGSAEPACEA